MGKIIAIANIKGGVGKTTTAVNLAACLAKEGKKVIIIDLDEKANTTESLGVKRELISVSCVDLMLGRVDALKCLIKTHYDNIYLVPYKAEDDRLDDILIVTEKGNQILSKQIQIYKEQYDYILIDTSPTNNIILESVLYASDSVLIPIECSYFAYNSLIQMTTIINQIQKIKKRKRKQLIIEGILITKFDNRNLFAYKIVDLIKKDFPTCVFNTQIQRSSHIEYAFLNSKTVIDFAYNSRGSKDYRDLAKEIISKNEVN